MKKKNQGEHKRKPEIRFVKSSFCSENRCVELGRSGEEFHLKDTKTNKVLVFDFEEMDVFLKGVKNGDFDYLLS